MDRRLGYAILASFVLHGLIVALWPRMRLPQTLKSVPFAMVHLIEETSSIGSTEKKEEGIESRLNKNLPTANKEKSANPVQEGKVIADHIIEALGPGGWDESGYDIPISDIRLPKQIVRPESIGDVQVWPEELTQPGGMDTGTPLPPNSEKGNRGLHIARVKLPVFKEEFPEEVITQQVPDITWKGKPRNWVVKPDETPTYRGDEEGLVILRFWVDEHGEVINAIPIQKLSAKLEEKALAYIFSWRFEPSPEMDIQEGIIRINFRLGQPET